MLKLYSRGSFLKLIKFLITTLFIFLSWANLLSNCAFGANFRVKDLIFDNSDRIISIVSDGNYKTNQTTANIPIPGNNNSVNILNDITTFTLTNPNRFVIDIPNARVSESKKYQIKNSSVLSQAIIEQNSKSPEIVRIVLYAINQADLNKFSVFSNGKDVVIKYNQNIITNAIRNKFYTPLGDQDKAQNLSVILNDNSHTNFSITPKIQTKYYLSQIAQNSDGLILKGLGQISMQKATYNQDNSKAEVILDNATLSKNLENRTYIIPSSNKTLSKNAVLLGISTLNNKKIKLTLEGEKLRDYRFVVSNDGQSIFVSHRTYVLTTAFSSELASITSYKAQKNQNGYWLFSANFDKPITYDTFELNDNFYLDIDNINNENASAFQNAIKSSNIKITMNKIHNDKIRFIIPLKTQNYTLNFAYGNMESNLKSFELCFREKQIPKQVQEEKKEEKQVIIPDKPNIVYIPKNENDIKDTKKKKPTSISSMKKVVLDPGHGGSDHGAIRASVSEKNLNLSVAKLVEEKLKKKNIYVYMTRSKDTTISLEDRVKYSNNEISPNIYVSIHANATVQEDSLGLEVHYYKDDSLKLANTIHEHFASSKNLKKWETKDRGVIKSRFYVINHTEAPSVLVEMGFISNPAEREKLLTKERQEELADSIAKGILEYLDKYDK